MATATNKYHLQQDAVQIISSHPSGIRFTPLLNQLKAHFPQVPEGTVVTAIRLLPTDIPSHVIKPSQGLYMPVNTTPANIVSGASSSGASTVSMTALGTTSILQEDQFYDTFAEYLQDDLEEVTVASRLGGSALRTKWGTPDVVGVYKPPAGAVVNFNKEIVTAEIKTDASQYVTAFGQATAYRLFSSKVYVVMPNTFTTNPNLKDEASRLESLCMLFGIGLVLFDLNVVAPNYTTPIKARRFTPEMYYVNKFAEDIKNSPSTKGLFQSLFS